MKKTLIGIAVGTGIVLITYFCIVLFIGVGPLELITQDLHRQRSRDELMTARSKWQQHDVDHYEIEVSFVGWPLLWFVCNSAEAPVTIEVKAGIVVKATGGDLNSCQDAYRQLTVDAMLEHVSQDIESYDPRQETFTVRYDPEWGYVVQYRAARTEGLFTSLGDGHSQITVHSFRQLP